MANAPLYRSRRDVIVAGVIAAVTVILVAIAYFSAPIRNAELNPAAEEHSDYGQLAQVPESFEETVRFPDSSPALSPVIIDGMTIGWYGSTLRAVTPDGTEAWTYSRDDELCALAGAWGKVVATFHTNVGCGDVVALDASSGTYAGTRSANAPDEIVSVSSSDRVGTVGAARTELWRSDLVRTVEYGEVEAPQEADMQPNPDCTITSALTRSELLAVTEVCGEETWLRFQDTTPEDSRQPDIEANHVISPGSVLVAVGENVAAVYDPTTTEVIGVNTEGVEISRSKVQPIDDLPALFEPAVADLPHHMSFFDGNNILLLDPASMAVTTIYEGAIGQGVAIGDRFVYPIEGGLAVADWSKQSIERTIPVDRGGYSGGVSLGSAGHSIVEKRGEELVFLSS